MMTEMIKSFLFLPFFITLSSVSREPGSELRSDTVLRPPSEPRSPLSFHFRCRVRRSRTESCCSARKHEDCHPMWQENHLHFQVSVAGLLFIGHADQTTCTSKNKRQLRSENANIIKQIF